MAVATPPSPPAVVRAWSRALNANDNAAAARLFAPEARVIQAPVFDVRVNFAGARLFNAGLPCGGTIIAMQRHGNRVVATFRLKKRPKHACSGVGEKAAAAFTVVQGKIVRWEQVAVPEKPTA
jgi:hypothetical protein